MKERLYRTCANGLRRLSPAGMRRLAGILGALVWHALPSRRRYAVQAVERHLGVDRAQATRIARRSFTENFLSFLEIVHADAFSLSRCVSVVVHPEYMASLQRETAPIVTATGHIGSWELMISLAEDLLPRRHRMVVVRKQKNVALNALMLRLRSVRGMQVVEHRNASEIVLPGLRSGGFAAFLVDHNSSRRESIFLPFLGEDAAVNTGPALLALRAKAVVYPVFLVRDDAGGHILYVSAPLRTAELSGSIGERVETIARHYTDAVARVVRKHPEQWFWMHKRWKTRPDKR